MRKLLIYLLLVIPGLIYAQSSAHVQIDSSFFLMGDHKQLDIAVVLGEHDRLQSMNFGLLDTMEYADFETFSIDSSHEPGVVNYKLDFTIWKPGIYELPEIPVVITSGTNIDTVLSNSLKLYVSPPKIDTTKLSDSITVLELIQPIKPIEDEPLLFEDWKWYLYGAVLLLLIAGLGWWIGRRKKKEPEPEPEIIIPPHIVAFDRLQKLRSKKLWEEGKDKEYQSELTHIIREYLEKRYDILALESTTKEVLKQLKSLDFPLAIKDNLRTVLNLADMVKFAKAKLPKEEHERFLDIAYELVDKTKEIERIDDNLNE